MRYWRNLKYRKFNRCDCPSCSALTGLRDWLEAPAGLWSTIFTVAAILVVAVLSYHYWPAAEMLAGTAVRG